MPGVAVFAAALMEWLPMLISGGRGAIALFEFGASAIDKMKDENRDPTPEEWATLNQMTDDLRNLLHSDDE